MTRRYKNDSDRYNPKIVPTNDCSIDKEDKNLCLSLFRCFIATISILTLKFIIFEIVSKLLRTH